VHPSAQAICRCHRERLRQTKKMAALSALLATLTLGFAGATELTKETWDAAVSGKTVFVKFLAPW